jgi:hypothetical protein
LWWPTESAADSVHMLVDDNVLDLEMDVVEEIYDELDGLDCVNWDVIVVDDEWSGQAMDWDAVYGGGMDVEVDGVVAAVVRVITVETEKQAYVAGYCLQKVFKTVCQYEVCHHHLVQLPADTTGGVSFIALKKWLKAVEQGSGLVVPSVCVVELVQQLELEELLYANIQRLATGRRLFAKL